MFATFRRLYPILPPARWRAARLILVAVASMCWILALLLLGGEFWQWVPWLIVAGLALKLLGYFWPDPWLPKLIHR